MTNLETPGGRRLVPSILEDAEELNKNAEAFQLKEQQFLSSLSERPDLLQGLVEHAQMELRRCLVRQDVAAHGNNTLAFQYLAGHVQALVDFIGWVSTYAESHTTFIKTQETKDA